MQGVTEKKPAVKASETWLSLITAVGAIVTAYTSSIEGAARWVALGVCVLLAAVYALFRTPLVNREGRPGVTTRAFWGALLGVVASVATAIGEAQIAGLPPQITQAASMVAGALVAAGYNVWRYRRKAS